MARHLDLHLVRPGSGPRLEVIEREEEPGALAGRELVGPVPGRRAEGEPLDVDKGRSSPDKECYELTTTKEGASVAAHGQSSNAGVTTPAPITYSDPLPCSGKTPPPGPRDKKPPPDKKETPKKHDDRGGSDGDAKAKSTKTKVKHVIPNTFDRDWLQTTEWVRMRGADFSYYEGIPDDPTIQKTYKMIVVYKGLDGEMLWTELQVVVTGGFDSDGYLPVRVSGTGDILDMNPLSNNTTRLILFDEQLISLDRKFLDKPGTHRQPRMP